MSDNDDENDDEYKEDNMSSSDNNEDIDINDKSTSEHPDDYKGLHKSGESEEEKKRVDDEDENDEEHSLLDSILRVRTTKTDRDSDDDDDDDEIRKQIVARTDNKAVLAPASTVTPPSYLASLLSSTVEVVDNRIAGVHKHDRFREVFTRRSPRVSQVNERHIPFNSVPTMGRMVFTSADNKLCLVVRDVYISTGSLGIDIQGYIISLDNTLELESLGNNGTIMNVGVSTTNDHLEIPTITDKWHSSDDVSGLQFAISSLNQPVNYYSFYVPEHSISMKKIYRVSVAHGGFNYAALTSFLGV